MVTISLPCVAIDGSRKNRGTEKLNDSARVPQAHGKLSQDPNPGLPCPDAGWFPLLGAAPNPGEERGIPL